MSDTQRINRISDIEMPVMNSSTAEIQVGSDLSRSSISTRIREGPEGKAIQQLKDHQGNTNLYSHYISRA
jgi:hypothetical protein